MKQQLLTEQEFYEIISKGIPPPEKLISELETFISLLYGAFDDSHSRAVEFIKANTKNKRANKWFYPQLLRYFVHNYLSDEGVQAQLVNENDEVLDSDEYEEQNWEQRVLASNGIAGIIKGYEFRILKAINGRLPPPDSSDPKNPKRKFYLQEHLKAYQPFLIPPDTYIQPQSLKPNILFLWDIDDNNFIKLYLSIPKGGDETRAFDFYTKLISHPVTTIKPEIKEEEKEEEPVSKVIQINKKPDSEGK